MKIKGKNRGSSLDDFLEEEGILAECEAVAVKRVLVWQIEEMMKKEQLTKKALAEKMNTSRAALDRLLNPENISVTLHTLEKAAVALGKHLKIELAV